MTTIEFLISLKDTNQYIKTIHADLEMLIEYFTPEIFDFNFKNHFPFTGKTFLDELKKDIENATFEQLSILSDVVLKLTKNHLQEERELYKFLKSYLKNYMIKNPSVLNVGKYYPIIVSSVCDEIEKTLNKPIDLHFQKLNKNIKAETSINYLGNHELNFSNSSKFLTPESYIYDIYCALYHESYHMIVNELDEDPKCFKIDILKYKIFDAILNIASLDTAKRFYTLSYIDLKEEMNANLYGLKKAKEELLKINPNFKVFSACSFLEKPYYNSGTVNNFTSFNLKDTQDNCFEQLLDKIILKNPTAVKGILAKVYNLDGSRKDFYSLKDDLNQALINYHEFQTDIFEFYYYLIYRSVRLKTPVELDALITDKKDSELIINSLKANENSLIQELKRLDETHLYYLINNFKKILSRQNITKELKNIQKLRNFLEDLPLMKESDTYGFK